MVKNATESSILKIVIKRLASLMALMLMVAHCNTAIADNHSRHGKSNDSAKKVEGSLECRFDLISCAKTLTVKTSPSGDIWRVWVYNQAIYYDRSSDQGLSYSQPQRVAIPAEDISARNENRPKIGFDQNKGVYLSWAMPREKRHTADIRFSYSDDYGKTFSLPITVNDDNLLTGHSFNEMFVSNNGQVQLVWLDGRQRLLNRDPNKKLNGSALFYAQANVKSGDTRFLNKALANGTCVCCRLAIDNNKNGNLAIFWRHIYGDNIREFALMTLNEQTSPKKISDDYWQINGCPHQGGGISITRDNRYHLVWFNQGQKGKGIFYSFADNKGNLLIQPQSVGSKQHHAVHPHVLATNNRVDIVWMELHDGQRQLHHTLSIDGGRSFTKRPVIAHAVNGADRPFLFRFGNRHFVSWLRFNQPPIIMPL